MPRRFAISDWLLVLSIFLFVSLAFVKRFTETATGAAREQPIACAWDGAIGWVISRLVSTMGIASGYLAVLVLAIYM